MVVKLSKLHYSQEAHDRLRSKYNSDNTVMGIAKWHYHFAVKEIQGKRGEILSREERQGVFRRILAGTKKGEYK